MDSIALQNAEFDALTELGMKWRSLRATPVVDDDYPEQRHYYESALNSFLRACAANRPSYVRIYTADGSDVLTFSELRSANIKRLPLFKNAKGETAHSGVNWSIADWFVAVMGELGEAANIQKKIRRNDFSAIGLESAKLSLADELADVQIYLDILAHKLGVDLGEATRNKFNLVSDRVGCKVKL